MPAPLDPLTLGEVLGRTMLPQPAVDRLFAAVLRPGSPTPWFLTTPLSSPEAAAIWLYQLLADTLGSRLHADRIVDAAWPVLRCHASYLEGRPAGRQFLVRVYDRRWAKVHGLPPLALDGGEYGVHFGPALESLQFDVVELYRRNEAVLAAARRRDRPCPLSA